MSSTEGGSTRTGWNRRSSAASFSMCLRYSSSVVAPTSRSSPRASIGFSMLPASTAPSAAPAPTIVCSSSMNVMISPSGVRDLLQDGLESLLELAAVLRAGDHRADVQRHQPLVLERFGDVAVDDPLREPFDDRGLPDPGLADQDGVVLRSARQDLDHAADLLVAADHRIELALPRLLGEVPAEALESLERLLRVLRGDALGATDLRQRSQHAVSREAHFGEQAMDGAVALEHREQEMLRRDVLVRQLLGLAAGGLQQTRRRRRQTDLHAFGVHLGLRLQYLVGLVPELLRHHAELMQQREHDPLGIGEQRVQHVLGIDLLMVAGRGLLVRFLQRCLGLDRQPVEFHPTLALSKSLLVMPYMR